ncbi:MAG: hypothetical protein D6689_13575 [Deltaproteobacteria bacterium]|nr:MAG: hypothetical protein D6689_13575 [Deltaproteobacteria bacterium]
MPAMTEADPTDRRQPWAVELDFDRRTVRPIALADAGASMAAGRFVWVDLHPDTLHAAARDLEVFGVPEEVIEDALAGDPATQHARYPHCLHMVLSGCRLRDRDFELQRVDVTVGERFLLTVHADRVEFVEGVKRDLPEDFAHHAQTPSFLIYELWDHLLDRYILVQDQFEERVARLQQRLIGAVDEDLFAEIGELAADLVHFRKVLLPARAVLTDLATRRSRFVSDATQPYLHNMVGTVERVLQDLLADREILSDALNLHVSAVGHRTNVIMQRLTVVSVLFLPLTFLVGVYGMNFDNMPELHWRWGYAAFWGVTAAITGGLLAFLARKKLL